MKSIAFDKLRQNKATALDVGASEKYGDLFTVIYEDDGTMTFQFDRSILIEPQSSNAINIRFR